MLIVDHEGNIVWYQDARNIAGVASEDTLASGLSIGHPTPGVAGQSTPTVLAILDHRRVVEYSLDGRVLLNLFKGAGDLTDSDLDERYAHHDVLRHPSGTAYSQDTIHVVTAKEITHDASGNPFLDADNRPNPYIDDGIMVFDATNGELLDDWQVSEVLTPFGFCPPGYWSPVDPNLQGCDWAHLNSVSVSEVGDWLLSLRALNRVINVLPPDPTDPTNPTTRFLEWQMYGENADTLSNDAGAGDWTLKEPIDTALLPNSFVGQHHATWTGPSTISLFDNQAGPSTFGMARGIEFDLDFTDLDKTDPDPNNHIPGTAEIVSAFDMGMGCPAVGSSYGLPNWADLPYAAREHKVTTCGERSTFMEFAASGSSPVWTMEVSCDEITGRPNSFLSQIYRGQPMTFDH